MNNDPMHVFLPYLPLVIVAIFLFRRTRQPRVIRPGQLWISPAILVVAIVKRLVARASGGIGHAHREFTAALPGNPATPG